MQRNGKKKLDSQVACKIKSLSLKLCYELRNRVTAMKIMEELKRMPFDENHNLGNIKVFARKKRLRAMFSN